MNLNREEALFAQAVEQPFEKCHVFLKTFCAGKPALRDHPEALLAAQE